MTPEIPVFVGKDDLTPEERRLLDEWQAKEQRRKAMEAIAPSKRPAPSSCATTTPMPRGAGAPGRPPS